MTSQFSYRYCGFAGRCLSFLTRTISSEQEQHKLSLAASLPAARLVSASFSTAVQLSGPLDYSVLLDGPTLSSWRCRVEPVPYV